MRQAGIHWLSMSRATSDGIHLWHWRPPGYASISYCDYTNRDLKYTYEDAAGWHTQVVDDQGNMGAYTSLALDDAGYPHISYMDWASGDLKYAYEDVAGWHAHVVDAAGYAGLHTSLALDKAGYPHVCYGDGVDYDLKYACEDAAGWHVQTVDSEGYTGLYTSLALDVFDRPHVSYAKTLGEPPYTYPEALKYAHADAAGWHIQIVDDDGYVGWHTSLTIDASGGLHISYCDALNQDLKYAHLGSPFSDAWAPSQPPSVSYRCSRPNPFGHWTEVSWVVPQAGRIDASVFDQLGRRVAVLADGVAIAGSRQLRWSPVGVPSGAYLLRVSLDGTTAAVQPLIYAR